MVSSRYVLVLKLTAMHPEEAVALTLKSASPNVLFAKALKVIVWLALAMLKVFTPLLVPRLNKSTHPPSQVRKGCLHPLLL